MISTPDTRSFRRSGTALSQSANMASSDTGKSARPSQREGRYSKPMAGADVIDDRLPVWPRRHGVAHHPVPQIRILDVEQLVESLALGVAGISKALVQPAAEQGIQFAGATTDAPAQAP